MPYHLDISERERQFLDDLPMSVEARARVKQFAVDFIANVDDDFRADPLSRPKPNSPYFCVRHIIRDRWGDGKVHTVEFHVNDDRASVGILLIVYIDHH